MSEVRSIWENCMIAAACIFASHSARTLVCCVLTAIVVSCAGELKPREVVLNEDSCALCRMAVSQREFAAQIVEPGGKVSFYDDIGCMFDEISIGKFAVDGIANGKFAPFVVDFESKAWIRADRAFYLKSEKLNTPMSYGFAATESRDKCAKLSENYPGEIQEFSEAIASVKAVRKNAG